MMTEEFKIERPAKGQLAIIEIEDGNLVIYHGNINESNENLHLIDDFIEENGEVKISARKVVTIRIDMTLTEHVGYAEVGNKKVGYKDFVAMLNKPENHVKEYSKHTWLMKLLGKPKIKYNYIWFYDQWAWGPKCKLKPELWQPKNYIANNYLFAKI
jgi:hypothetical protein